MTTEASSRTKQSAEWDEEYRMVVMIRGRGDKGAEEAKIPSIHNISINIPLTISPISV